MKQGEAVGKFRRSRAVIFNLAPLITSIDRKPMERYLLEFDVLRRNAEERLIVGEAFPHTIVSNFAHVECGPVAEWEIDSAGKCSGVVGFS